MDIDNFDEIDFYGSPLVTRFSNDGLFASKKNSLDCLEISTTLNLTSMTQTIKQCRICLDHIEDKINVFITPCKCAGSLRYVHKQCFLTWLGRLYDSKTKIEQRVISTEGMQCQLCKQKIYLHYIKQICCNTMNQITDKVKKHYISFLILTTFFVLDVGALIYLIYAAQTMSFSLNMNTSSNIIVILAISLLGIILLFTIFNLMRLFVLKSNNKLQSFQIEKPIPKYKQRRKSQVIPK